MRQRRYTSDVVARANEHFSAGWKYSEIARLLGREFGRQPSQTTVRCWVDPAYARDLAAKHRRTERTRHLRLVPPKPKVMSRERATSRMREMRDAGLSFWAISVVAEMWWGESLSEDTVARRLGEGRKAGRGAVAGRAVERRAA